MNKVGIAIISTAVMATLAVGGTVFAQSTTAGATTVGAHQGWLPGSNGGARRAPGVFGTVSAISGDTITVTSKGYGSNVTPTTYSVDATNATVTKSGAASSVSAIAVGDTVMVQGTVSGTNVTATKINDGVMGMGGMGMMRNGVFGTVSAISGDTIMVTGKTGPQGGTAATYTVDGTNATVTKDGAASALSDIAVGDTVMVQGAVTGTTVTATKINDGVGMMGGRGGMGAGASIAGNGEPVVGGAVTAISGTNLTVTNKSNVTYTIDASSATVVKGNATSSVSSIAVGDNVLIQGTVNGNSVVASSVIDQGAAAGSASGPAKGGISGFLGSIGGLFHKLFGFF